MDVKSGQMAFKVEVAMKKLLLMIMLMVSMGDALAASSECAQLAQQIQQMQQMGGGDPNILSDLYHQALEMRCDNINVPNLGRLTQAQEAVNDNISGIANGVRLSLSRVQAQIASDANLYASRIGAATTKEALLEALESGLEQVRLDYAAAMNPTNGTVYQPYLVAKNGFNTLNSLSLAQQQASGIISGGRLVTLKKVMSEALDTATGLPIDQNLFSPGYMNVNNMHFYAEVGGANGNGALGAAVIVLSNAYNNKVASLN